ncbi:MAG: hypothetical protein O3A18_12630 [Planctomycetota bacterium]|jgi:hypothetical protein|nr:hypothetical protein [Planctomycetota bacterium]
MPIPPPRPPAADPPHGRFGPPSIPAPYRLPGGHRAVAASSQGRLIAGTEMPTTPRRLPPLEKLADDGTPSQLLLDTDDAGKDSGGDSEFRRSTLSMAISLGVHVVALLVLAVIVTGMNHGPTVQPLLISARGEEAEEDLDFSEAVELEMADPPVMDQPLEPVLAEAIVDAPEIEVDVTSAGIDTQLEPIVMAWDQQGSDPGDFMAELRTGRGRQGRAGAGGNAGAGGFGGEVGRRLARAGARSGAIQVSLAWNNFNDIDLHVVTPSGEHLFFGHSRSLCGGHLDVDMNASGPDTRDAVENVYWPKRFAPAGTFKVYVHHFSQHDTVDATPFEVHVLVDGVTQSYTGQVRSGERAILVAEFKRRPTTPANTVATDDGFRE